MAIDKSNPKIVPPKINVQKSNIPKDIRKLPYWGLWKWKHVVDKWTKVPISPTGQHIDARSYSFTLKEALSHMSQGGIADGIGFFFSPDHDYFGIDFDDCVEDGIIINPEVKKHVEDLDSYYEISVSGSGIHIIGKGASKLNGVDRRFIYAGTRYFTFSGFGQGKIRDISKQVNKRFSVGSGSDSPKVVKGKGESDISLADLYRIIMNIRPDISEPDWFLVCKAIHYKTGGSQEGWELFKKWSAGTYCEKDQKYKDYKEEDCLKKWNRCKFKAGQMVGLPTLREVEKNYPVKKKLAPKELFKKKLELMEYNKFSLNVKHLPKNMREAAQEVARFNRVSIDPVITTMLMIFSAAINKKIRIVEREGLVHNCSMGSIIGMPSGGRKSAIDRPLIHPFKEFEKRKMQEWESGQAKSTAEVKVLKAQYLRIEKDDSIDEETKVDMMTAIQKKIGNLSRPRPKYIESDATEERLSDSLAKNNEVMFIHSDDARNTIRNITGRYDNTSENIYITGLTGDTYRRSRVKDDIEIVLYSPCINLCLKVQLDLLRELVTKTSMRESGLLARMFIKVLDENVADQFRESEDEQDLDISKMVTYNKAVKAVLDYNGPEVLAMLSKEARKRRIEFSNEYANKLDTVWSNYKDVSNKIVTLSVKMAVVVAVMKNPDGIFTDAKQEFGLPRFEISEKDYLKGKEIVTVLMEQTLDVLNKLEQNDIINGAIKVMERLKKDKETRGATEWTLGDIQNKFQQSLRNGFVPSWVNCLVEAEILFRDGKSYTLAEEI